MCLDEGKVLMHGRGHHRAVRRNQAHDVARMHQHLTLEQGFVKRNEPGMVRQPMHAFQLLHVVIGFHAHPDVQTHLVFRHLVKRLHINGAAQKVFSSAAPSIAFDHTQNIRPHPKHLGGG